MSSSHQPMSSISSTITTSDFPGSDFNTSPVDYHHPLGNEMYGHEIYTHTPTELVPGPYQQMNGGPAMPQIDPSLTGGRADLGAGTNMDFSTSFLDPALQQYPAPSDNNGFAVGQMQYTAPEIDQFQSWYLAIDFDLAAFNKSFKTPTAIEFFGPNGSLKHHDMPSPDTGGDLSLDVPWEVDLIPDIQFMVGSLPLAMMTED